MSSEDMTDNEEEKIGPTQFLTKTFMLVDDQTTNEVVSWNETGTSFIIWNPTELASVLLPKFFKHNNFSSFVCELYTYGFRKIVPDRWEFVNISFHKFQSRLLCDIQGSKVSTVSTSPVSSQQHVVDLVTPEGSPSNEGQTSSLSNSDLIEENYKLKKENGELNNKLNNMNVLFNNLSNLMWNQTDDKEVKIWKETPRSILLSENQVGEGSGKVPMEMDGELSPKLFGVNIGGKMSKRYDHLQLKLGGGGTYHPYNNMRR